MTDLDNVMTGVLTQGMDSTTHPQPTPAEMATMYEEIEAERYELAGLQFNTVMQQDPQRREDLRQCRMFGTRAITGAHTPDEAVRIATALLSMRLPDSHVSQVTDRVIDLNPRPRVVTPHAVARALAQFNDQWQRERPTPGQVAARAAWPTQR